MPVWTLAAILLTPVLLAGLLTWQYERSAWQASATSASKYTLLEAVLVPFTIAAVAYLVSSTMRR